jgi:cystathionine beta-lyase
MAAYDESEDWLEELRAYLDGNFAMMHALLADKLPEAVFQIPEGTYLGFVDLRALGRTKPSEKTDFKRRCLRSVGEDFVENADCYCALTSLAQGACSRRD